MSEQSDIHQTEKLVQQSEKLIVIETKLDGIANTLNLQLTHIKDTVDRNHKDITADMEHAKANAKQNHASLERMLDKKLDRSELAAHIKEGDDRFQLVKDAIVTKADEREFKLVQKLVFGFVGLVLVAVVGAIIALVVLKPEPHRVAAPTVQSVQVQQPATKVDGTH